ncbi:MAG TPA: ABC transporter substrate-binding protein [Solirubrobacteraceae bacterium]|nr:ABC transporter substrate-binding protein [Solirubrobacteraceae bacterium]
MAALAATALVAAALILGTGGSPPAAAQENGKPIITIGLEQGIDNLNPIRGYTVAAFESWNLQWATLTDKKAEDFSIAPGLAESWEGSGKEYTYTLRPDLKWSDGTPLTAEDVAWTINTSREEEWLNHFATTGKLTAEALSDTEIKVTSEVDDPKLPILDVYILPKHVYGEFDKKGRQKFNGETDVGSGPFTLDEFKKGQFARFKANPNYWQGQPALDEVIIRKFNNADAMVAALRSGEIDFVQYVPETQFLALEEDGDFTTVKGEQGGFDEFAINGGDGLKKPHPALEDIEVRTAIMHAIDKQTIVDRVLRGLGTPAQAMSVSADPKWTPEIPAEEQFDFDLEKAKQILEDAGYRDTDGDGVREMPGGGEPLNFRYAVRSESESSAPIAEFITGWLKDIGIETTQKSYDDGQLGEVIGRGDYDMFVWGWIPYVDPDPQLGYFTCDQVSSDPDDPLNYYNDANFCDPEYDKLYEEQKTELDPERRVEIVHEMLRRFYSQAVYAPLYYQADLQAYRTGRFEGFQHQPAETGPVLFSNTSPSYATLKVAAADATNTAAAGGGDDGGGSAGLIAGIVIALIAVAGLAWALMRRRTADERE